MKKTKKPAKKTKPKTPANTVKKAAAPKDSADQKEAKRIKAHKSGGGTVDNMSADLKACDNNSSTWFFNHDLEEGNNSFDWAKCIPKGFVLLPNSLHQIQRSAKDAHAYLKLCGYKTFWDMLDLLKQKKKTAFQVTETYNGETKPLYKQKVTYWESNNAARDYIEENFPDVGFNEHAGAVEEDVFDGDAIEDDIICKVTIVVREVPYKKQKLE